MDEGRSVIEDVSTYKLTSSLAADVWFGASFTLDAVLDATLKSTSTEPPGRLVFARVHVKYAGMHGRTDGWLEISALLEHVREPV